ncbi:Glutathione synthetase {ECO:0000256/PIRNR:PIRNR001558} Short=GSH-S {ECO:0000256/PIRNR:PIRNR001558}; {ECO:0000256/PIRNR:PIRNR001558} [Serendipita indica DSM 11827]|uniref:Glutathione synthetase n=1 Tax=Serendipita indica (strain DSM 11827) TaxID=1109443 RepID=G4TYL4_SERID|nr:Glutathione synthetase {ECO:0000256/PIRNR:PIRNR001558} Short=GSH-S {ECO:0000256/PIRNR:PIRNR001558}; {ECO:0000256/PIRNR:PIRNR001558} [Serendipita indica DSM 11827]CCA76407.1 related to glutathione synthase [Serendipita indica DSM 11827]
MPLPPWPPSLSQAQLDELLLQATTYALAHGLLYLPPNSSNLPPPAIPASAIHAPFALFPTPFPRHLFEHAMKLQRIYNVLYTRVASDEAFLDQILSAETGVGKVDEFVGNLWRIWKDVRTEGLVQPLQLGIFRSDYLLHGEEGQDMTIKQVEFNTISASFGALSQAVDGLHRYLLASTGYFSCSHILKASNLPVNDTLTQLVKGLVMAHEAYLQSTASSSAPTPPPNVRAPRILFVVQPNERNVFDQRPLEYALLHQHGIHVLRRTFDELALATVSEDDGRRLYVRDSALCSADEGEKAKEAIEISVIYFRAGYTPTDFPTHAQFETRKMLERSRAIKCPSIAIQLAGSKKVQAVLSDPGVVEKFLLPTSSAGNQVLDDNVFSPKEVEELRASWMEMYSLDAPNAIERTLTQHADMVLKPQREGGGNNVYKAHIPPFLEKLEEKEREAWIAMKLIRVPKGARNWLARSGTGGVLANVVSELGTFGWALFGRSSPSSTSQPEAKSMMELREGGGGYLLRTKGEDSDEGGVATGFSVLDSVVLVD